MAFHNLTSIGGNGWHFLCQRAAAGSDTNVNVRAMGGVSDVYWGNFLFQWAVGSFVNYVPSGVGPCDRDTGTT